MLRKVLIVDDNEINRRMLRRMLCADYKILEAKDGAEALDVMGREGAEISAVLLDIMMPGIDGYEVLKQIGADAALSQIPVIVATGNTDEGSEDKCLALGASDFVTKPYKPETIRHRLRNMIKLRETAAMVNALQRDSLTGLFTREHFFQKAAEMIAEREAGYYVLACLDIDNFKVINDQYGSATGDKVLKSIAKILMQKSEEDEGICCRVAADDFAILYPSGKIAAYIAEQRARSLALVREVALPVSISIGRYIVDDKTLSVSAMYDRALLAQSTVKGRFDEHAATYDEAMRDNLLRVHDIVNEMAGALEGGQFELWFQPQYNHSTGALIGAEALVRWRHPIKGLVMPKDFIPVFERNGFIYELDKHVWERSCALLRKWIDEGRSPLPVSVNISRYDIFREDFMEIITGYVKKYDVPVSLLRLEITESAFAKSSEQIIGAVKQLIDYGFTVEIDDFGSGYSSLNTLKSVPSQIVKLDMKFLEDDDNSGRGGNIIESVVRMVKWLGMSVIAEGVETHEHANYLKSIGCNYVQGYLYAKPMPVAEYEALAKTVGKEEKMIVLETVENMDNNAFWDPKSMDTLIFNTYIGGACIFEWHNDRIWIIRANDKYAKTVCGEDGTIDDVLRLVWEEHMDAEAAEATRAAIQRAIETGEDSIYEAAYFDLPGRKGTTHLHTTFRLIARTSDRCLLYATNEDITAQREAELSERRMTEQLQAVMDNVGSGILAVAVRGEEIEYIFRNDRYFEIHGYTKEQYDAEVESAFDIIHPDDRPRIQKAVEKANEIGKTATEEYRVVRRDGEERWVRTNISMRRFEHMDRPVQFSVISDITAEKQAMEMIPYILSATMKYSADLVFVKDRDFKYICCSPPFVKFTRQKSESDVIGRNDYEFFTKEEADHFRGDDVLLYEKGEPLVDYVEPIPSDDGIQHYCRTSKYILRDAAGEIIGMYGIGRDITEYRAAFDRLKLLTDNIPGGIASYVATADGIKSIYFNDGFCNMLGYTREEYEKVTKSSIVSHVFEEDVPALMEQVKAVVSDDTPLDCTCRVRSRDGDYKWVNIRGNCYERREDAVYINAIMFDVTERKLAEEAARVHEQEMRLAMSHMGKMLCEYNPATRTLSVPESYAAEYKLPGVIPDVPDRILCENIIDGATVDAYKGLYDAILRGDTTGSAEYRCMRSDGTYRWERSEFYTIHDSDMNPVKTIITVDDTTSQHQKYELESNRPKRGEENLLFRALFNLTTRETLEYFDKDGNPIPEEKQTGPLRGEDRLKAVFADDEGFERFLDLHNVEGLLEKFAAGETEFSIEYRRHMQDGSITWVRNILRMMKKPGGDDVMLFEYCYVIEEEKLEELMYGILVSANYDYVARINGRNGNYTVISNHSIKHGIPSQRGNDSDVIAREIAEKYVHQDDREMTIQNTSREGIKRNLADREQFQFTCREVQPDGSIRYKKLTAYYLDRALEIIVLSREDVTQIMEEEAKKKAVLASALEAANQASHAKTQFLSRMSHELRTPMNAIIGLAALSAADVGNPRVMEDNIAKIGMSARYLLSLINDILEMSRIESGRMTLAESQFDFEEFISNLNAIIYAQASAKGVDYDVIINSYLQSAYVGDSTKLQEILVNILGNAVKFTPAGGKVTFAIEQVKCAGKLATMRFVVNDTGVGIDAEFIPHMFEPFSQEKLNLTSSSTGTGLGLAITKNLVEMMNGHIGVQSVKNVGTVFTVDVQLGVSEQSQQYLDLVASMNLSRLKALVVDDDVVVCKSTESVLKAMGLTAEWVDSGALAVERVREVHSLNQDFDTIFIDWKMPDMDGIETTRQIRGIVGPDVTIIIMTAYDWQAIETEAREAGVDMFMEKPLFQSSIVKAFEKIFMANKSKIEPITQQTFDFSGKRILLVEDNALNMEIAKRLLEKTGAEVVMANNGLEAMEIYTTAAEGYFDVILMDIRMPVMDGLTATKNIRNLRKKGSKDIPIIAMTANAFDEDVELSLVSGMNAHLTKPIEPKILFATLQRHMKR